MTFEEALRTIAAQLGLNADELVAYAAEDTILGYYDGNPVGVPFTNDGKLLYALVRALRPRRILETGTNHGGSANHLAHAVRANGAGEIITVDISPASTLNGVDSDLKGLVRHVIADVNEWVKTTPESNFDFIHEDADHGSASVYAVHANLARLSPEGCVILSHDTATGVGPYIESGIRAAGFEMPPTYEYDGSPCGFSVMRYGGQR